MISQGFLGNLGWISSTLLSGGTCCGCLQLGLAPGERKTVQRPQRCMAPRDVWSVLADVSCSSDSTVVPSQRRSESYSPQSLLS